MLTYTPFDSNHSGPACGLRSNPLEGALGSVNVGRAERYGSLIGGAALLTTGLSRRSIPGLLLAFAGGALILRGLSGHCRLYRSIGVSTSSQGRFGVPHGTGRKVEKTIEIDRQPQEIFRFWRNLENLPEFMDNIESVTMMDDHRSHWVAKAPGGRRLEWDAEIVNEHPGEMISWQTLPGASIQSAGTVRFSPTADGRGTKVRVVFEYHPPGGALGDGVGRMIGRDAASQVGHDLARLKQILEQGHASVPSA
jgi:uncharacterized membrane protein